MEQFRSQRRHYLLGKHHPHSLIRIPPHSISFVAQCLPTLHGLLLRLFPSLSAADSYLRTQNLDQNNASGKAIQRIYNLAMPSAMRLPSLDDDEKSGGRNGKDPRHDSWRGFVQSMGIAVDSKDGKTTPSAQRPSSLIKLGPARRDLERVDYE